MLTFPMMIMREIESTYTGFDGTKMFLRTWVPDEEPRAVIIGIHGLGSHSGLQNFIGTTFAKRGMPFYAPDLRGFGRFEGLKGHVDSFDHWIEDQSLYQLFLVLIGYKTVILLIPLCMKNSL